jgi:hypothetical protein
MMLAAPDAPHTVHLPRCNYCLAPNADAICPVCWSYHDGDKHLARLMAEDLGWDCGPFCRFCHDDTETEPCCWEGLTIGDVWIKDARVGDLWVTEQAKKAGRIVEIHEVQTQEVELHKWQIWVKIPGHPKPYPYLRCRGDIFQTEVLGACNKQACFRHQREIGGEGRVICMDHWDAWQVGWRAAA